MGIYMKAFIYSGGDIYAENITEHPKSDDITIAADSGYKNALTLGENIQLIVGDMDSLDENIVPDKIEIIRLKPEKDMTDTQVAVEVAIERGADQIIIVGGIGCRLDHSLSTISILESLDLRHIQAYVTNGKNRVHFIRSTSYLLPKSSYKFFSLLATDEIIKGVDIEGGKYPLKNAKLKRNMQFAISNEITGNCALISVKKGGIYIIESND